MKALADYGQKIDGLRGRCPVRAALDVIQGRWKPSVLYYLREKGTQRFSELQALLPEVTGQALTVQLRQLEADCVVHRVIHAEVPVRVEYSLTEDGLALSKVMELLGQWGEGYMARVEASDGSITIPER
jgi:DNA-binding HxlR family transcriptional regulator